MTRFVPDQLVSVLASAHVSNGQVDALLVTAAADARASVGVDLEAVGVDGALVDAAEVFRLVLPAAAVVEAVANLCQR